MIFEFSKAKAMFVCGAGHGIGLSIVKEILYQFPQINVIATFRLRYKAEKLFQLRQDFPDRLKIFQVDPVNETQISDLSIELLSDGIRLDAVINTVGLLHNDSINPEKSLKDFDNRNFIELIKVNTLVTPTLVKHFEKLIPKEIPTAFISLSAKVGSIEDNRMGGWYSYRASKAALNMLIKTIAIELQRKRFKALVLSIHPGTTDTELSKPFIKNTKYTIHTSEESARNILKIIDKRSIQETGQFLSWNQEIIPW